VNAQVYYSCEDGMAKLDDQWFSEVHDTLWPGRAFSLKIDRISFQQRSEYQDICIFENSSVGRVLALDGIIQLTEADEFAYQEMIAHVPLFAHPNPRHVLIIGGGDGGVAREAERHPCVERIDLCEIDSMVIEASKKFLPFTAVGFNDPRLNVHVEDGAAFVKDHADAYDVIIVDSSDPVGPAVALFEETFYKSLNRSLRSDGILMTQAESIWLHHDIIKKILTASRNLFNIVAYCFSCVPTYPSGQIGFLCASKKYEIKRPLRTPDANVRKALRYYTPQIHETSFHLPAFAEGL
jgi:spermidine synthase